MQTLRHARFLARLVLAWWAFSLGVACASPLVNPQSIELVCASGGAMKLIIKTADGNEASSHTLDCPLCVALSAPPPVISSITLGPGACAAAAALGAHRQPYGCATAATRPTHPLLIHRSQPRCIVA
jgi:hypothetical protein